MSSTDDRIVSMHFDNADFERRLSDTLHSLDKLNQSIQNTGSKQGLSDVQKSVDSFSTSRMASSLEAINSKFSAMGVVGASVIQKLTQGVMGFAANVAYKAKTDILGPIITGGKDRATALEQARFQFQGLGIDVNKGMASALAAVKGTAYGLNDAATVAAQFGASGIKAGDQMTRALTGISGIAAMTGRSYAEIGQIFTSAAGAGKVSNMDLQEFAIRGLNAAAAYAKQTGKTEAQVHAMATKGTLDFASFADAMDKAFGKHATEANKTYTGSLSNLHAALSRMGASFFSDRIDQERDLFNALTPVVDKLTTALKPLTTEILKVTGEGSKAMIKFLGSVNLKPYSAAISGFVHDIGAFAAMIKIYFDIIKTAFKDIFPTSFADNLSSIAGLFDVLIKILTPSGPAIAQITHIFEALFAVFSILRNVVRGVFDVIVAFFGSFTSKNPHAALDTLDAIANALIRLQNYLVVQGKMADFFQKLADYASKPGQVIQKLVDDIKNFFSVADHHGSIDGLSNSLSGMSSIGDKLHVIFSRVGADLDVAFNHIVIWFSELGHRIAASITPGSFQGALSALNTGLLVGIGLLLKGFLDKGFKFDIGGTGMIGQFTSGLKNINQSLKLMQTDLKAKTLMDIAAAIAILAASIVVLSLIKPAALQQAMIAMAVGFGQLVLVMKELDKIGGVGGSAKLSLLGTAMIGMATGTLVLAGAVKVLSSIDPNNLSKGMAAIAGALLLLIGAAKIMADSSLGMIAAGIAFNAMATGLAIMAGVVRLFALMSWQELIHGLAGLGGVLLIIAVAMNVMPVASTVAAGLAMIPLAIGLSILSGVLRIFGTMSWGELEKGLLGLAGGLVIIALAMNMMPLSLPITAAGLLLVAIALGVMVPSIKMIGDMDLGSLARALGAIAIMLGILAIAMSGMSSAIPGALALLIVSNAMLVLTGVLKILGSMSWGTILKGLGALAAVLAVLGIAAFLLEPVIPALLGLGAALTLVGAGFALFGAGAFLVATAFSIMSVAGTAGALAIIAALTLMIKAIPNFITQLVTSITESGKQILTGATAILKILDGLLTQLLALVVHQAPHIAAALVAIVTAALILIRGKFPDVVQTAFDLLITFLTALQKNMPKVVAEAVAVIVAFVDALAKNVDKLIGAAVNLITSFLAAIARKAGDIAFAGLGILVALLGGIAKNIGKVGEAVGNIITNFLTALANDASKVTTAGANVIINFVTGLGKNGDKIVVAATNVVIAFVTAIGSNFLRFINAAFTAIETFLYGLDQAIRTNEPVIIGQAFQLGKDIIDGIIQGISKNSGGLVDSILGAVIPGYDAAKAVLKSRSPSKLFAELGASIPAGLAQGISGDDSPRQSVVRHAEEIVRAFSETLSGIPNSLDGMSDLRPVITPILDLSKVKEQATGLGGMLSAGSFVPSVSFSQAKEIATTAEIVSKNSPPPPPAPSNLKFEQHINAPTALSTNDIYKNTKSQIALAKEELNI